MFGKFGTRTTLVVLVSHLKYISRMYIALKRKARTYKSSLSLAIVRWGMSTYFMNSWCVMLMLPKRSLQVCGSVQSTLMRPEGSLCICDKCFGHFDGCWRGRRALYKFAKSIQSALMGFDVADELFLSLLHAFRAFWWALKRPENSLRVCGIRSKRHDKHWCDVPNGGLVFGHLWHSITNMSLIYKVKKL